MFLHKEKKCLALLTEVLTSSIFWAAFIFTISPSGVERRTRLPRHVKH